MEKSIVFIAGKAAVGKSILSKKYEEEGYTVISMDEIIRENVLPKLDELAEEPWLVFKLYKDDNSNDIINKAREMFIIEMKKVIEDGSKFVIEGSLTNCDTIRQIFDGVKFDMYYVKPKDAETYIARLMERFCKAPNDYGRIGFLRVADGDGLGLTDYKKNGINGEVISELIRTVGKREYPKMDETYEHYKKYFEVIEYLN